MKFFSNKTNHLIGLDISDYSLKAVQLKKVSDQIKVHALGRVDLPAGIIEQGEIKKEKEASTFLRSLLNEPVFGKFSGHALAACLPETKTFIKLLVISKSPNKLADLVEAEALKHLPFRRPDIYLDWQLVKEDEESWQVLVGAVPRYLADQYVDFFDKLNLNCEALEIEPLTICRALLKEESPVLSIKLPPTNYLVIDLGAARSSLIFYSGVTILFTASLPFSGRRITSQIADNLKISFNQAEKEKISYCDGAKNKEAIEKIIRENLEELAQKIGEALEYYLDYFSDRGSINRVLLTGGGANLFGLEKVVSDIISASTQIGDPLTNLQVSAEERKSIFSLGDREADEFTTAIGLALRDFV